MKQRLAVFATAAALVAFALPGIIAAADAQVVAGRVTGAHGTLLVAASNQMTVYTFDKDVARSGASNCTGGCLTTWPALTVAAGDTPTGGAGVTGTLGSITRADDGALQVTYNGLPLYFFSHDAAPGDTNGIYPNWRAVVLAAATPPTTSTAPAETRSGSGSDPMPALLLAGLAGLGALVTIRRLAAARS